MHDDTYPGIQTLPTARVNGVAESGDGRGKRIADRTPWLNLPDPFDNLRVRVWLDYRQDVADLLTAPGPKPDGSPGETPAETSERVMEFLKTVILQQDGWDDGLEGEPIHDRAGNPIKEKDGTYKCYGPLPQPDTDEFWERISTPLGKAISERFFKELEDQAAKGKSRKLQPPKRGSLRRR